MPEELLSALGMLVAVTAILGLTYWFTKYVVGRGAVGGSSNDKSGTFCVLAQITIGRGQRLLLIRINGRCLLLGVTAENITLLAELTEEEAESWKQGTENGTPSTAFLETMRNLMSRKK